MTKPQRISLMAELWPAACQSQGWHAEDREWRLFVCSVAVSDPIHSVEDWLAAMHRDEPPARVLKSTNDLNDKDDFTRVKSLLKLLADHVEVTDAQTRTMRYKVTEQTKCLALYLSPAQPLDQSAIRNPKSAIGYVRAIIRNRFKRESVEDLSPRDLRWLLMTLQNRLHNKKTGLRVKAGDSIHDMSLKAGIKCHCKACETARKETVNAGEPDWRV